MFRLKIAVVLFTLTLTLGSVKCSNEVEDSNELWIAEDFDDSETVADVENFDDMSPVAQPGLKFLQYSPRGSATKDVSPRLSFTYTLGTRVNGDRLLVRYKSPRTDSGTPLDFKQVETFEFEAYLTYVEIVVEQSTNESKVTLASGGEGHKFITLETEATHTLYFNYTTQIYGYF